MDAEQKRAIRDRILEQIAKDKINPGCNKHQLMQAIENVANFRSVAANRRALDQAIEVPDLPAHIKARVLAEVFAEEKEAERMQLAVEKRNE